jgi:rRNA maturation protein Nop10
MPTSITPPPKDDEVECGNCGAYIYHDLLKCPNCGVYLVNPFPHIDLDEPAKIRPKSRFALWVESVMRKLRGEPHVAEELFTGALREAFLFDELLRKVGGDRTVVERLIAFERQQKPNATRLICLQNAIQRWERENT